MSKRLISTDFIQKPTGNPNKEINSKITFIESVLQDLEHVRRIVKGKQIKRGFIYSAEPNETSWLQGASSALEKHTQLEIHINDAHDPLGKMQKAQKGRPALYLE